MAEYIEREALLKWAREFYPNNLQFASAVINAPTADVAEVRHGKWTRHEKDGATFADYECSICSAYPTGGIRSYYCPRCGAKMDLGDDEE